MELKIKNFNIDEFIPKFQEGGEMAPPADGGTEGAATPAEAPAEGGDPMQELLAACQQALESQDCNLAMQVCQALMQMAGGGGAPQEAPEGQAPVYRRGGRLVRWINK